MDFPSGFSALCRGIFPEISRAMPGKCPETSRQTPRKIANKSQELRKNYPGSSPKSSRESLGHSLGSLSKRILIPKCEGQYLTIMLGTPWEILQGAWGIFVSSSGSPWGSLSQCLGNIGQALGECLGDCLGESWASLAKCFWDSDKISNIFGSLSWEGF